MSFVFDTSRWVPYVESPRPPPVEIDLRDGDAMATPRLVDAVWTDAIVGGVEAALYLRDEWGGIEHERDISLLIHYKDQKRLRQLCSYTHSAIENEDKRGLVYLLSFAEYNWLLKQLCFYCDESQATAPDRLNSMYQYVTDNVVPACSACNMLKCRHLPSVFVGLMQHIVQNTQIGPNICMMCGFYAENTDLCVHCAKFNKQHQRLRDKAHLIAAKFAPVGTKQGACVVCNWIGELCFDTKKCWKCYNTYIAVFWSDRASYFNLLPVPINRHLDMFK